MKLLRTSLYDEHKKLNARIIPFAGWEMPVQYSSIIEEHLWVRKHAGIFDVSHMGQIVVQGKDSISFLEKLTPNFVENQKISQIRYNAILNHNGCIKDDITIFRQDEYKFLIIVNASNTNKIWEYLNQEKDSYSFKDLKIHNFSNEFSMLAIQGPEAEEKVIEVFPEYSNELKNLSYYYFTEIQFQGENIIISRTGYTGEDGFEILCSHKIGIRLWNQWILNNVKPCGLGARDSLRLEALYPLYGHELTEDRTPVESGIGWIVKDKPVDYYGKERLLYQKKNNPEKIIIPFKMIDKGIPREGYKVYNFNESSTNEWIGQVQSGLFSPSLNIGIGTTYLPFYYKNSEKEIFINIREKYFKAKIHSGSFVKGTAGKKNN